MSVWSNFVVVASEESHSVKLGTITLSTNWIGTSSPYTQVVTVTGVITDENSMVTLQPSALQNISLIEDNVESLIIENNNGTLIVYARGQVPSTQMTIQCTVREVLT